MSDLRRGKLGLILVDHALRIKIPCLIGPSAHVEVFSLFLCPCSEPS